MAKKPTTEKKPSAKRAPAKKALATAVKKLPFANAFDEIGEIRDQIAECKTSDDLLEVRKRVLNNLSTLPDTTEKKRAIAIFKDLKDENTFSANYRVLVMATGVHNLCIQSVKLNKP